MGLSQSVCGFLSCSQKDNKENKESKSHEEHLNHRKNDKTKCCLCGVVKRSDGCIQKHYKTPEHKMETIKHCLKENIDIPIDDFIKIQKLYNRTYNRSTDGKFLNKPLDNNRYIKEYKCNNI